MPLNRADVGHRVIVRHLDGERDGRPQFSDVLGELLRYDDVVVVRTASGREVTVPATEVAAGKRIPPPPPRRRPRVPVGAEAGPADAAVDPPAVDPHAVDPHAVDAPALHAPVVDPHAVDDLELERIAALGWQGLESERLGGWLLRAGGGWTGRANSVLPLGDPGVDLAAAVAHVERWYAARGLPPTVQVPLPAREDLRAALTGLGWTDRWGAVVMSARVADVRAATPRATDLPPVTVADDPSPDWLAAYHYRGGALPAVAPGVLRAASAPVFASVVEDGATVAICRAAVDEGWVGVTAVEVDPAHRRRGLATHLLLGVLDVAVARGATAAYLQADDTNTAARTLYGRAGFRDHHVYRYHRPAGLP